MSFKFYAIENNKIQRILPSMFFSEKRGNKQEGFWTSIGSTADNADNYETRVIYIYIYIYKSYVAKN